MIRRVKSSVHLLLVTPDSESPESASRGPGPVATVISAAFNLTLTESVNIKSRPYATSSFSASLKQGLLNDFQLVELCQ